MPAIASTEVIQPRALSAEARRQLTDSLYAVHQQIFDGVERESFARYVVDSKAEHTWIQLHRNAAGELVGYFALHVFERQLGGVPTSVFRAEAGLLRAYRGSGAPVRFSLGRVIRYLLKHPGRRILYLGSLVHPSAYTHLARRFGEVWPRREQETPPELQALMGTLAEEFGLEQVEPERPLVRRVGWRTRDSKEEREYWRQCDKPEARYFLEANPGYGEGHGLVTVVPLTSSNLLGAVRAQVERRLGQWVERLAARVRHTPLGARLLSSGVARQRSLAPTGLQGESSRPPGHRPSALA